MVSNLIPQEWGAGRLLEQRDLRHEGWEQRQEGLIEFLLYSSLEKPCNGLVGINLLSPAMTRLFILDKQQFTFTLI